MLMAAVRDIARKWTARESQRLSVFLSARLLRDGKSIPVHVLDISRAGALIHAECPQGAGEIVWLMWRSNELLARVAWSHGHRFGLTFNKTLSPLQLQHFISEGQAAADQRELLLKQ